MNTHSSGSARCSPCAPPAPRLNRPLAHPWDTAPRPSPVRAADAPGARPTRRHSCMGPRRCAQGAALRHTVGEQPRRRGDGGAPGERPRCRRWRGPGWARRSARPRAARRPGAAPAAPRLPPRPPRSVRAPAHAQLGSLQRSFRPCMPPPAGCPGSGTRAGPPAAPAPARRRFLTQRRPLHCGHTGAANALPAASNTSGSSSSWSPCKGLIRRASPRAAALRQQRRRDLLQPGRQLAGHHSLQRLRLLPALPVHLRGAAARTSVLF